MAAIVPELETRRRVSSSSSTFYRVVQRLGAGGNSHVYLVETITGENRGILFALKLFVRLERAERQERFRQEIDFLKNAKHPSIMRVFDDGVLPDQSGRDRLDYPFVVAEYLPTTLRDVMRAPVRMIDKISYALQILSGLAYLAKQASPVVHRDIKPENIFVRGPACILGDFGLMKVLSSDDVKDDQAFMAESAGARLPRFYRTPDLVDYCRNKGELTSKSDVFQAGLVLAELFTGINPLAPSDDILSPVAIDDLDMIPGVHGPMIGTVIRNMLELDPKRRPSAEDLFDSWEGLFQQGVDLASSLEGRAF